MRRIAAVFVVVILSVSAHAATRTWTGAAGNLWSNPANWDTGVPVAGDAVRFDAVTPSMSPVNDLPSGLTLTAMSVNAGYNISGNGIVITSLLTAQGSTTVSLPVTLGGSVLFSGTSGGTVNFAMPVNLNGNALHVQQTFPEMTIILSNTISGAGTIGTTGNVWLTGHNTFAGIAYASSITATTNDALGVAGGDPNGTQVDTLNLNGVAIGNESITLAGVLSCSGTCSLAGPVTSASWGVIRVTGSGSFTISGRITAAGGFLMTGDGAGRLTLTNGTSSFENAGLSKLTLRLGATNALNVVDLLSLSGATLDMNNAGATTGRFTIDNDPSNTFAAGAQPLVVLSAGTPPHLDGTLTLTAGFVPSAPAYLIIDNRSPYPILSQFDGLPEGGSFTFNGNTYTITYQGGDGNDVVLFVNSPGFPTTTSLSSSNNPANEGDAVTFTATVTSGSGVPAGTVTFRDGASPLATVALNNGTATFTTSTLAAGSHQITAVYNPSSQHAPSTSNTVVQVITATPPQVSVSNVSLDEGNSGTTPAVFTITLSHASANPVVVQYMTQDGSAMEGTDYLRANGTLTFAPGETRKSVVVEVIGDTQPENDEVFTLRTSPGGATGMAMIRNDDVATATTYEYATVAGQPLTLDLYTPVGSGPFPVILWVHGTDPTENPALHELGRGYAVARVEFRSPDTAKFPAQIADLKAAVRYLRAHATELHIDPLRIGAWGRGTGAWFASLLGTAPEAFDDVTEGNPAFSSRISAVVEWGGETDLIGLLTDPSNCSVSGSVEAQFLGCAIPSCPSTATTASPITWTSSADAAFLIAHSTTDCTVPPAQATRFATALQNAGASVVLKIVTDVYWTSQQALTDADALFDAKLKDMEVPAKRRTTRH